MFETVVEPVLLSNSNPINTRGNRCERVLSHRRLAIDDSQQSVPREAHQSHSKMIRH